MKSALLCLLLLSAVVLVCNGLFINNKCTDGTIMVSCFVDPCMGKTCPSHPGAVCRSNYCGGCNYDFYEGVHKVTDACLLLS